METRNTSILDDDLVAAAKTDHHIVADLFGGINERLKRRHIEITHVDAIAGIEVLDGIDAHPLAEQELVVAFTAIEFVASGTAEKKISAPAASEFIVAFTADKCVVALPAEQVVIAFAAVDQIVST